MLSQEENQLLARVGAGTAMGGLFRQYWLPALLSSELEVDGPPRRVRILGEDLVAFRDSLGRPGLLGNNCSHRRASLFFGRNEECGLRCVYHGWKYDVEGRCVDMPNEPAFRWTDPGSQDSAEDSSLEAEAEGSGFKAKIHHKAYPCRERGDVIWVYMGDLADPPGLPDFEWAMVPTEQRTVTYRWQSCNWAQALEGGIDSSHISFLHRRLSDVRGNGGGDRTIFYRARDTHPRFELVDTDYGMMIAARRDAEGSSYYWRISQFLMPSHTMIPPTGPAGHGGHAWVPVDDENVITWTMSVHPERAAGEREAALRAGLATHASPDQLAPPTTEPYGWCRSALTPENDYLLDRKAQRTELFFGVRGIWAQDQAVQESMGPIYDRSQEHLGGSDSAVVRMRRRLIDAARALRDEGVPPPGAFQPEIYRVRSVSVILPKEASWVDSTREQVLAPGG